MKPMEVTTLTTESTMGDTTTTTVTTAVRITIRMDITMLMADIMIRTTDQANTEDTMEATTTTTVPTADRIIIRMDITMHMTDIRIRTTDRANMALTTDQQADHRITDQQADLTMILIIRDTTVNTEDTMILTIAGTGDTMDIAANRGQIITIPTIVDITIPTKDITMITSMGIMIPIMENITIPTVNITMITSVADIIANRHTITTTITNEHLNIMMTPTDIHHIRRSDIAITATLGQNGLFIRLKGPQEVIATTRMLSEVTATTRITPLMVASPRLCRMTPLMVASPRLCHMVPHLTDILSQASRLTDSLLRHLTLSQATQVILVIKQLSKTQFFYKRNSYTDSPPPPSFPSFLSPIPLLKNFPLSTCEGKKHSFLKSANDLLL